MELDHIISFVAVAEDLHFSRAAVRLHKSQPALSKQIRQLETELGLSLFARDRRSVRLTAEGNVLLIKAKEAIGAVNCLRTTAEQLRRGEAGCIRIGFVPTAPHDVLPAVMRQFRRLHPSVDCVLIEAVSQDQLAALENGSLDVGFLRPPNREYGNLRWLTVLKDFFFVAVPRHHHLAAKARIALSDLASEPFVLVARRSFPSVYDHVIECCRKAGFTPKVVQEGSQMHAVAGLVGAGCGVSLLPPSVRHLKLRDVVYRPLWPERISSVLALAYSMENQSPLVNSFLRVSRDYVKSRAEKKDYAR